MKFFQSCLLVGPGVLCRRLFPLGQLDKRYPSMVSGNKATIALVAHRASVDLPPSVEAPTVYTEGDLGNGGLSLSRSYSSIV